MPDTHRLRALDVFRGLTVALMILVNCPGGTDVYASLDHAAWNGLTVADLVFPAFLVIVGVSAVLSQAARRARGQSTAQIERHAAARALGLFAFGLLVNAFIFREPGGGIRFLGVLQRIALCSLGVSAFLVLDRPALEAPAAALILGLYWLLLTRLSAPGYPAGDLSPDGNFASWLDRTLMGGHMMTPVQDPEGLLATLPALATSLLGLVAGRRLVRARAQPRSAAALAAAGLALAAAGWAWSGSFPFNKHLWTSSYVLTAGGLALAGLAACLLAFGETPPRAVGPVESLGRHALAAYVLSGFVYDLLGFLPAGGAHGGLRRRIVALAFGSWLSPKNAALAFAAAFVLLSAAAAVAAERRLGRKS